MTRTQFYYFYTLFWLYSMV